MKELSRTEIGVCENGDPVMILSYEENHPTAHDVNGAPAHFELHRVLRGGTAVATFNDLDAAEQLADLLVGASSEPPATLASTPPASTTSSSNTFTDAPHTQNELEAMTVAELTEVAGSAGVTVPAGPKSAIIEALLRAGA